MMKTQITLFLILLVASGLHAQKRSDFGVFLQSNTASQWVKTPTHPEDGTFSYNFQPGHGGGLFCLGALTDRIFVEGRVSYVRKGFSKSIQTNSTSVRNAYALHYVGFDQILKIQLLEIATSPLYMNLGVRNERRIGNTIGSSISNDAGYEPIVTSDYNKWSFGGIAGIGYELHPGLWVDIGMNPDIAPSMDEDHVLIRNFMWFLNLSVALDRRTKACAGLGAEQKKL